MIYAEDVQPVHKVIYQAKQMQYQNITKMIMSEFFVPTATTKFKLIKVTGDATEPVTMMFVMNVLAVSES